MTDTIYALSSGRPPAGIAVIRISGPASFAIHALFTAAAPVTELRNAQVRALRDPDSNDVLDNALVIRFSGPDTVTGEDLVEWHCHGGHAVVQAVLAALERQGRVGNGRFSLREAEAGEFTRRAFENGRIDLNEAEGLADLLSAETESQRRAALMMADGHFSRQLEEWRVRLLGMSAQIESLLDFSDEDDVPDEGLESGVRLNLINLTDDMTKHLFAPSAERLRDGIHLVLAGPPNAGKSTLLNALAGREAAIVSDIAGTTRDRIEVPVSLGGVAFVLTDTAGLTESTDDRIEQIGIDRAKQAIEGADIVLWLGAAEDCPRDDALRLSAQMDRPGWVKPDDIDICLSAQTGENMNMLVDILLDRARHLIPAEGSYALHKRQRDGVQTITGLLQEAQFETDYLIIAELLRLARDAMDRLIGRSGVEDMLDSLFSRFCIGK